MAQSRASTSPAPKARVAPLKSQSPKIAISAPKIAKMVILFLKMSAVIKGTITHSSPVIKATLELKVSFRA